MKIPPKKPQFFKPILPGFNDGIRIPTSFSKYLSGKMYHQAILRRGGKKWRVKVNDKFLREGWSTFALENNLDLGCIVVFKYEGNMVFEVLVFDRNQCEMEDPARNGDGRNANPCCKEGQVWEEKVSSRDAEKVPSRHAESDSSHCILTVKPYMIKWSYMNLPIKFARRNDLSSRRCEIILLDSQERSWRLNLRPQPEGHIRIEWKSTMRELLAANGLNEGDLFKFELVENGETPILKLLTDLETDPRPETEATRPILDQSRPCQGKGKRTDQAKTESDSVSNIMPYNLRKSTLCEMKDPARDGDGRNANSCCKDKQGWEEKMSSRDAEKVPSRHAESNSSHRISTVKLYMIKRSFMYFPIKFARRNGLWHRNCEIILLDPQERSWRLNLRPILNGRTYLRRKSTVRELLAANGLKIGDRFKFELVENGETPILNLLTDLEADPRPKTGVA